MQNYPKMSAIFCGALLSLVLISGDVMADRVILLPDGQSVILKDDGTWAYVQEGISGGLLLNFGKTKDQQGQCYAWPTLTNNTDRFIDGVAINYSTHLNTGKTLRRGTLTYNIIGVGKNATQQEYLTDYFPSAKCNQIEYIQIDDIDKCMISGTLINTKTCFDLLEVSAEDIATIK